MIFLICNELIEQKEFIYDISYICERGGRPINEDSVLVENDNKSILIAVSDGLGAHGGGDVASKVAIEIARDEYMKSGKIKKKDIHRIFQNIDDAIVDRQTENIKMKTTLSCVFLHDKLMYASHLGDTRIYVFDNKMHFTADHSVAYEKFKNRDGINDIRNNPKRHILTAALGVGKIRPPDTFKRKIKGELSVLVCTDGFWEYVNEAEMLNSRRNTTNAREWLESMLKCHLNKADTFNDNYSAICLRIIKNKGGRNLCSIKV